VGLLPVVMQTYDTWVPSKLQVKCNRELVEKQMDLFYEHRISTDSLVPLPLASRSIVS